MIVRDRTLACMGNVSWIQLASVLKAGREIVVILIFVTWYNAQSFQHVEIQQLSPMVIYVNAVKVSLRLHLVACRNVFIQSRIAKEGIALLITEENQFVDAMEPDIMDHNAI